MDVFLKAAAGVLITVVLCLTLAKQSKDLALLLAMTVCCMVTAAAIAYLTPLFGFFERLQQIGQLNSDMMRLLLKAVGIGLLAEIAATICADGGNGALGKAVKLLASAVILWISVPLFERLLELVGDILVMV